MDKPVKCIIVEGEKRDYRYVEEMLKTFFVGKCQIVTVILPAGQNIYMLYNSLKEDDFETDLIEILRESGNEALVKELEGYTVQDFDEIFMFFDYDCQEDNLNRDNSQDIVQEMLSFFNNETEHGKLYLSYPMVEAVYDYKIGQCDARTKCFLPISEITNYKNIVGENNPIASRHLGYEEWKEIIAIFALRIQCLFNMDKIDFKQYRDNVTTETIYDKQKYYVVKSSVVYVLSAFPEFLLDYFREDFWAKHVKRNKFKYDACEKVS